MKLLLSILFFVLVTQVFSQTIPPTSTFSLEMTGANYVQVPHNSLFNVNTDVTYEGWFNLCSEGTILSKNWCNGQAGYNLFFRPTQLIEFTANRTSSCDGAVASISSSNTFELNEWHHFALTLDIVGTTTIVTLYMDHNSTPEFQTTINWNLNTNTEPLRLGAYKFLNGSMGLFSTGRIYDFRTYNQVLPFASQCLQTPVVTPNMRLNFISSNGTVFTNVGSGGTAFNGTNVSGGIASTPNFLSTSLSLYNTLINTPLDSYCINDLIQLSTTNTASSYTWTVLAPGSTSPITIGTGNSTNYTPLNSGSHIFEVIENIGNCSSKAQSSLDVDGCLNIKATNVHFDIYPNPTVGIFTIQSSERLLRIQILDNAGRLVSEITNSDSNQVIVDISKVADGIYQVLTTTEATTYISKIEVKK